MSDVNVSTSNSATAGWWLRFRSFWRFWFSFEPMRHAKWEAWLMRLGVALITAPTVCGASRFTSLPTPHGMGAWGWDFTWVGNDAFMHQWMIPVLGISLLLYVAGLLPVVTLIPALVVSIAHGVVGNSQGAIGHTTQIVSVTLLAAWMAAVWGHVCALRKQRLPHDFNAGQLGLDWARQSVMATYVVSAITKLYESGGNWLADTPYFGLQIAKSTDMAYYTHLVPADNAAWLAQYFVDHPLVAQFALGFGLPLELFAFTALLNRRIALVYGALLYLFHQTVTEVMNLGFLYHKGLLLVLFINPVWWGVQGVLSLWRRTQSPAGKLPSEPTPC
ncbi:MAG: hypothetical protein ACAI34_16415 [Verrucomicrobium sp.]